MPKQDVSIARHFADLPDPRVDRRIGSAARLSQVVAAWGKERNERKVGVKWQFTTADARVKLRRLYPAPQKC